VPSRSTFTTGRVLAGFLMLGGAIGWYAAFALTLDRFRLLEDPEASLGCNFSLVVQCGRNLESAQGAVFGFPNPILGLAGFVAPIVVGAAVLAGARFARWFWLLFLAGMTFAIGFVVWLISQSVFVLGTLCPWCMVVWAVTIPMFLGVLFTTLSNGALPLPAAARRFSGRLLGWTPTIALGCFVAVAVVAQVRLDVLSYL
jgi:uncharacterized membrane protein